MPPYRTRHLHGEPDWFTNRWPLTPHERNAASRNQPSDSADTPSNSFSPKFPQFFSFCAVQRVDLQGQMSFGQQENVPM